VTTAEVTPHEDHYIHLRVSKDRLTEDWEFVEKCYRVELAAAADDLIEHVRARWEAARS
jgi:hypothetical protein